MFKKLWIFLLLLAISAPSVAYARYCNNPQCAMCNRIFGYMPGWGPKRTTTPVQAPTPKPPVVEEPEEPIVEEPTEPIVEPPKPADLPDKPALLDLDPTFEPMPQEAVNPMLQYVYPMEHETLYDLGCGDGRVLIEAVKSFGCKAVGIEINPDTATMAIENVEKIGRILIVQGNIKDYNLDKADVITMYLFPDLIEEILPQIRPGTRVISFEHKIPGVNCFEKTMEVEGVEYKFYTWVKDPQRIVQYKTDAIPPQVPVISSSAKPFSLIE